MDRKVIKPIRPMFMALLAIYLFGYLYLNGQPFCSQDPCDSQYKDLVAHSTGDIPGSCTTFVASYGDKVLFGNNEDFNPADTYLWGVAPTKETYGGVYFGYRYGRPQGGINEKGLAFDALALPQTELNPHPEMPPKGSSDTQFLGKIMSHSATVDEAIAFAKRFNWGESISFQVLLADAAGEAVIISAGSNGELAFTRKPGGNGYLVGTNFNRANPKNRTDPPPCWRYDTAETMLAQIENGSDFSVEHFEVILDAVHVEGAEQNTLYSNIFELPNGVIHLYYWHQFDKVLTLNVAEKIDGDTSPIRLSDLFTQGTITQAEGEYQQHLKRAAREDWLNKNGKIIIAGGGTIILSLSGFMVYSFNRNKLREV